jgi:hypothetical protein
MEGFVQRLIEKGKTEDVRLWQQQNEELEGKGA